jgi:GNAT superfamily N-acetyltransferase
MEITSLRKEFLPEAAALFVQNFRRLRREVAALPDEMEDAERIVRALANMLASCPGVAALEEGRLVGYMVWYVVDHFRNTGRRAAYCPVTGHAATQGDQPAIYRALYREAARHWAQSGCQVHALTLLASDEGAINTWFWNGFGLWVMDAIRSVRPLDNPPSTDLIIRKALPGDAAALGILDAEHMQHYAAPPVLMVPQQPGSPAEFAQFIEDAPNSVWLALEGGEAVGFIRFAGDSFGATEIVGSETTIAITGAFVRPPYRGRKAAPAMLDAALREYAQRGFERCSVDFESFNPEAATFWLRYFDPVCLSLVRAPET